MGDRPACRHGEITGIGMQLTAHQGEQAGLAAAVGACDADLMARVDGEAGVLQ
jgi:hypothetical protein